MPLIFRDLSDCMDMFPTALLQTHLNIPEISWGIKLNEHKITLWTTPLT